MKIRLSHIIPVFILLLILRKTCNVRKINIPNRFIIDSFKWLTACQPSLSRFYRPNTVRNLDDTNLTIEYKAFTSRSIRWQQQNASINFTAWHQITSSFSAYSHAVKASANLRINIAVCTKGLKLPFAKYVVTAKRTLSRAQKLPSQRSLCTKFNSDTGNIIPRCSFWENYSTYRMASTPVRCSPSNDSSEQGAVAVSR